MKHVSIACVAATAAWSLSACGGGDGGGGSGASTILTYMANIHSAQPTEVPAGQAAITLDWGQSQLTKNALGVPLDDSNRTNITDAIIGHYTQDVAYLESHFLDIEMLPTALYRGNIAAGTVVDFSTLMTASGQAFTGIDTTGTWLVALQCGICGIPAPWYLTVLKPSSTATNTTLIASDANNYSFSSILKLPPVKIAPMAADITIDWSGVTKDFMGHSVAGRIDMVEFVPVNMSLADLEVELNETGELSPAQLITSPPPALELAGATTKTAMLSTFTIGNTAPVTTEAIQHFTNPATFPPAQTTYLAIVANGVMLGKGSLMIQAVLVDPASTNTVVKITSAP